MENALIRHFPFDPFVTDVRDLTGDCADAGYPIQGFSQGLTPVSCVPWPVFDRAGSSGALFRACVHRRGTYRRRIPLLPRMHGRLGERSAPLRQRRRHTEPLDAIQNRCEQITSHRTCANWNVTYFACRTTLAPILMSFSRTWSTTVPGVTAVE